MKEFFEYLKTSINTRVPGIKTVRMWNNQLLHSNGSQTREVRGFRNEKPFKYPACFVEFIVIQANSLPMGIIDYILTVRFRFGKESYKFERLETFDFCDDFLSDIQLLAPTELSGLTFTTLQLQQSEFDEDFNNVEAPYLDYRTRYRSRAAYARRTDILHGPITVVAVPTVGEEEEILFGSTDIFWGNTVVTFAD